MHKVLITGITGFLGAAVAEALINQGVEVVGLKRTTSNIWRCESIANQINWISIDDEGLWEKLILEQNPDSIVHCAWIGVEADERDVWTIQEKNIMLLERLIKICSSLALCKFVFVGSQAEYGDFNEKISEDAIALPRNAYGKAKLACLALLKTFCESNNVNWIWIRLFSVFGEKEGDNWLIPSVINKMLHDQEMNFTLGEQKYAYLYIKDFANLISNLLKTSIDSGVYNVSAEEARSLKSILEEIKAIVNPKFKINLGALPYRQFQLMNLQGDTSKLKKQIGAIEVTDFNTALQQTIRYYRSKYTNYESI